jgi:hypothetical protein
MGAGHSVFWEAKMTYPKALYHRSEPTRVVKDADEHAALGAGWCESPAELAGELEVEVPAELGGFLSDVPGAPPKRRRRSAAA